MFKISSLRWNYLHALMMILATAIMLISRATYPLILIATVSFLYFIIIRRKELRSLSPWGGYANYITVLRLIIIASIGITYETLGSIYIFFLALLAVLLDGLDGYLARKFNHQSETGKFLDMEADTFYVLVLSTISWLLYLLPFWILIPALMRFVFVITVNLLHWDIQKDKRTRYGPTIAVLHFTALLLPFIAPYWLFVPICSVTSVFIILSFIYSFYLVEK